MDRGVACSGVAATASGALPQLAPLPPSILRRRRTEAGAGLGNLEASEALRACLANACLEGEVEQLMEVFQSHFDFVAGRGGWLHDAEAEVRKFSECLSDASGSRGRA
eukprot:CAMPEP_0179204468 /NCGR_PEP_ID=MMETSP0796-20121207/101929_1 /TAXON_ID=73915 /ORGANISM="Pyrodinium bahamense, Strain pbaha01" /LENGTH=107 /DNA_ID=CAMNT_0020909347 /DNA_START=28 /DNA_END=347 /DNA_ORIENTATION=+